MTVKQLRAWRQPSASSRRNAPELCDRLTLCKLRGRREGRVPIAPVGPVQKSTGGRTTGSTGNIRPSLRNGLTAYTCSSR
ncbi:hypothetical protein XH93_02360 [Bradyrhizobium sp. CCBAU 51753]|nr:hypothetical protein XH93_02360 [Bradyrhizobium sp. CCBAU 51753]